MCLYCVALFVGAVGQCKACAFIEGVSQSGLSPHRSLVRIQEATRCEFKQGPIRSYMAVLAGYIWHTFR